MSTIYMSQLSTLPLMEGEQDQGHFPTFHLANDPPILFPFMINNPVDHHGQGYGDQHLRQQILGESNQQFNDHMMMAGGSDVFATPSPFRATIQSIGSDMIQRSLYDPYDIESKRGDGSTSKYWASTTPPAKMRITRKAAANDPEGGAARKPRRRAQAQADESQQQQAMGVIRVCSDCNTTKTPLWRSGPCGPKSLCNACGIRQRKARRAMAAAAAAAAAASNGGAVAVCTAVSDAPQAKPALAKKERRAADVDRSLPFKKRCKMVDHAAAATAVTAAKATANVAAPKKDHDHNFGEDVAAAAPIVSKVGPPAVAFFHGFPRNEITDAAMLLMTLSCGLVRS